MSDNIKSAIGQLAGTHLADTVFSLRCSVDSVDIGSRSCNCTPIDSKSTASLEAVNLMPEVDDGFLLIPSVGSTVIVIYSTYTKPYVSMFSQIDAVFATQGSWQFNDGSFGGLIMLKDPSNADGGLLQRLNKIESDINNLKQLLDNVLSVPVNEPGNGSPSAFQQAMKGVLSNYYSKELIQTENTDLENTLITHGK